MTVAIQKEWLEQLQRLVTNRLDLAALKGRRVAAILGDVPSTYAKSPRLWNAAFQALKLPAAYISLDIPTGRLSEVVALLKKGDAFLGGSVTVPYKMEILSFLDEVDPLAQKIGAVNTLVRTPEGRLIGANTDGLGGIRCLTQPLGPDEKPLFNSLEGIRVLLIGCGGAAQALAVFLGDAIGKKGELVVANRNLEKARSLADRISKAYLARSRFVPEERIPDQIQGVDLVVNATTKGQAGWRRAGKGGWTCLEPYSCLAPASPAVVGEDLEEAARCSRWFSGSLEDIRKNQEASLRILGTVPARVPCYDIIYAPLETVFLRQARWSGHRTLNGKAMNILQAALAFCRYSCRELLKEQGHGGPETVLRVAEIMEKIW